MVSIAHAVLGLVLVAASHSTVRADSINANPTSVGDGINKLTNSNPVAGHPVPKESTTYIVPDAVQPLAKALADMPTTGNGNGTDARTRMLEATSTDVQRLEDHFGTAMERNVDVLLSGDYRAATYDPTPWPSSYWPTYADGINYRWAGDSEPSASEKYAAAFGLNVKQFTETVSRNTGILAWSGNRPCGQKSDCDSLNDGSQCAIRRGENRGWCIPGWYGICHAWAPASIMEKEPRCPVTKNGQTFHVFDIKALMTQIYDGAGVGIVFTGARYDGPDWPESRDEYGRFTDAAERDLGPGFFHIAISNVLRRFKKGFVVDVTASSQVWNQPVRGYEVLENYEVSRTDAAQAWFNTNQYPFNSEATSLMYVRTRLSWMNEAVEDGPLIENGRADAYTASRDYEYVLELNAQRQIIGGEWIGQSQTEHPDFLWFPTGRPDISTVTAIGLSYKNVVELLDASVKCGGDVTPPDNGGDCAPSGGSCGNNNVGAKCCQSSGDYCQPWNPWEYQCRAAPQECGTQQVGVDFYGNDIKALYSILPEQCCAECARTPGCKAYTFVNYNADGRAACYLKSGTGERRQVVGVVSAEVKNPLPPSDNSCSTPVGGMCGSASGHGCCPSGAYCQAWNSGYYQCINTPPQCGVQFTDVDFYGNDIRFVSNVSPAQCCEECARTNGCRVYTFINENPDGLTTCYLKSSGAGFSSKVGAVSGVLN